MKKALVSALAAFCLVLALCAGSRGEGWDTPVNIADSYIRLCAAALRQNTEIPERYAAFPEVLEEICGFLDGSSRAARAMRDAAAAMRQPGDESAREAEEQLRVAASELREEDVHTPFALTDLAAAAGYRLLPVWDIAQFIDAFSHRAEAGPARFVMVCPGQVRAQIWQSTSYREDTTLIINVANQCGICNFNQIYNDDGLLMFDDINYFPGTRIARAWRDGGVAALSEEERLTLNEALGIAGATAGTDAERERQVHDALCARVSYYTDSGERGRKDSAVGALLDGLADCDGYSDAFYLCGTLAGLQVRYMPGDSVGESATDLSEDVSEEWLEKQDPDNGHMWNLVCLDGRWVAVDVTWDDGDSDVYYANYNLGDERLGLTHLWDERTKLVQMEYAMPNELRDPSLAVAPIDSWDGLYDVCRSASWSRPERLLIACPLDSDVEAAREWISECLCSTGVIRYSWHSQNAILELFRLEYMPEFRVCDTAGEAADYIEACAAAGVRDFTLYFTPELSRRMFANEHAGIAALIGASSLVDTAYSYNEAERRVGISDAVYHETRNLAESFDDIRRILRQQLVERRDSAWFVMPEGADFESLSQDISDVIYACGAQSYSWSLCGNRVMISDVVYYPEFALVSDEGRLAEYLRYCRSAGITSFRVYCPGDLYGYLAADGFSRFFGLLSEAGCQVDSIGYDDATGMLAVEDAAW